MSFRTAIRPFASYGLAALFLLAMTPFVAHDAEAGRKGFKSAAASAPAIARANRQDDSAEANTLAQADGNEQTEGADTGAAAGAASSKPRVEQAAAPIEIPVPGCAPGMMCTVCVAGCLNGTNSIVATAMRPAPLAPPKAVAKAAPKAPEAPASPMAQADKPEPSQASAIKAEAAAPPPQPNAAHPAVINASPDKTTEPAIEQETTGAAAGASPAGPDIIKN